MWFVFPQIEGLGSSWMAQRYAIASAAEAEAYLRHPVLGSRLVECAEALLAIEGRSAREILGPPDDLKLKSSATLFAAVSPPGSAFERVLDKYFAGERDEATLRRIANGWPRRWRATTACTLPSSTAGIDRSTRGRRKPCSLPRGMQTLRDGWRPST